MRSQFPLKSILLTTLLALAMCSVSRSETIIVLRHSDKGLDGKLTDTGKVRSEWMGELFKFAQVDHIFCASAKANPDVDDTRLKQTADGICKIIFPDGKTPQDFVAYHHFDNGADADIANWLVGPNLAGNAIKPDDHVDIVILHHEDIPPLADQLTGGHSGLDVKDFKTNAYNNVFIFTRQTPTEKFTMLRLDYQPALSTAPTR